MKKIQAIAAAVLFTVSAFAQQKELDYKVDYKPATVYNTTTTNIGKVTITFSGEGADDMVAAQGMDNPMVQEMNTSMKGILTTGKQNGNIIPFQMDLPAEGNADIAKIMPNGAKIYGKKEIGKTPVFDSISAKGAQKMVKDAMFETMKATVEKSFVPAKKLKIGESFSQDIPLSIPMGPMELQMTNKMTYTLKKIEGGKAYFDTTSILTASTEVEGQELKGNGTGTGKIIYDIAAAYNVLQEDDVKMSMDMEMQGIQMNIATDTKTSIATQLTPAK